MEKEQLYSKIEGVSLTLSTQKGKRRSMRLLRGKSVFDDVQHRFTFIENEPRGARSVEVGRTLHARYVRRPDGLYTVTFRFSAEEKFLRSTLQAEVRQIVWECTQDSYSHQ